MPFLVQDFFIIKGKKIFVQKAMEPCIPDFEESGFMKIEKENKKDIKSQIEFRGSRNKLCTLAKKKVFGPIV